MSVIARLQMNANGICNPFSHTYQLLRSHDCAVAPEVCAGTRAIKYLPDDIPVGPTNIGPVHKAINGRAKKAKVDVLGDEGANGNRRWFLKPAFYAFMEQRALQPA